ncbi:MAG: FMN-binding protein [Spirochaetes bacterium]|nr:FMN-binding protein [Spirochaetota bacterium]
MVKKIVVILLVVVVGGISLVRVAFGTLSASIWTPTPMAVGPRAIHSLNPGTFRGIGDGYYGEIVLDVTVDNTGILDIEVVSHLDTPAFWNMAYTNLMPLIIAINSTGVNAVSGATYTSRGLIAAIEDAMLQAGADLVSLRTAPEAPAAVADGAPNGAASALGPFAAGTFVGIGAGGYYGDIHVSVTFSQARLVDLEVVYDNETPMFANMAYAALIPGVLQAQTYNVDTVSGATYTSTAFLAAIQDAVRQATGGGAAAAAFTPGTQTGSAEGYNGAVTVAVTFSATSIVSIEVVSHDETPMFANMVWQNMIPAMVAAQSANVDAVSGATYTSQALMQAVSQAIAAAQ